MRRIKQIDPELYEEILDMESYLIRDHDKKMKKIKQVKDFVVKYQTRKARDLFDAIKEEAQTPWKGLS